MLQHFIEHLQWGTDLGKLEVHLPCMKTPFPSNVCKNGKPVSAQMNNQKGEAPASTEEMTMKQE